MAVHVLVLALQFLLYSVNSVYREPNTVPMKLGVLEKNATSQEEHLQELSKRLENQCQRLEDLAYTGHAVRNFLDIEHMISEKLELTSAKQSSTSYSGSASRAIDGMKNYRYSGGSCIHTYSYQWRGPWYWQAKLKEPSVVFRVEITNRGDCCGYRLSNFEVQGYDEDPSIKTQTPKVCYKYDAVAEYAVTEVIHCDKPIRALYLRVDFKGNRRTLNFCEFEAFGVRERLINSFAIQSSNDFEKIDSRAWRGIDEDPRTCTYTDAETDSDAWWEQDLRQTKTVVGVTLTNRNDDKAKWLRDIVVSVHEHRPSSCTEDEATTSSLCARHEEAVGQGEEVTLTCTTPVTGRYLRVTKKRRAGEALSLCEVVVKTED